MLPDTDVDAAAESDVRTRRTRYIERIRAVPAARIAIGCCNDAHDLCPFGEVNVVEPCIVRDRSAKRVNGRLEAQDLFNRHRRPRVIGFERFPCVWMVRNGVQHVTYRGDGRVDAG